MARMVGVMRSPIIRASMLRRGEIIVDNFAGGGGASTGVEAAIGRPIDLAINHSPEAIALHKANHPSTQHYCQSVWDVDPAQACAGREVGLAWFSPDCTHFSRAKGGKPRSKKVRSLAWVVNRWARTVRPRVIVLENVEEFLTWGPLDNDGHPIEEHAGLTFRFWLGKLRSHGYRIEYRPLVAADYGTPTTRRRLFLVARRDDQEISWPEPTHGKGRTSWRAAHEIIDWSIPCRSIFGRDKPLAEATLRRIAEGIRRYVIECAQPFIMPVTHHDSSKRQRGIDQPLPTITGAHRGELALVAPLLTKAFGGPNGNSNAGIDIRSPLGAVTSRDHHWLVSAFLTKFYGTSTGSGMQQPLPTITANRRGGGHLAEVRAFLVKYYGAEKSQQQSLFDPLHTIPTKDRFGLVMVRGEPYQIADIGMRMLAPHELFAAQGFPDDYVIAPEFEGKPLTKTAQVELVGNSVCPPLAQAIVAANLGGRLAEVA